MTEFENYLFTTKARPTNRRELRAMMQDRKRFEPLLKMAGDVIEQAIELVNDAETETESELFYIHYHDKFNAICDAIQRKEPKYWRINRKFYTETIKPVLSCTA
jgi:hypothetical protein